MQTAFFVYPTEYNFHEGHKAHSGQRVEILRELQNGVDYDFEGDRMFRVRAVDGWEGDVWESELSDFEVDV